MIFGILGDGQDGSAFAIWGCRFAVGTGLEDGRFVCCWVVQEMDRMAGEGLANCRSSLLFRFVFQAGGERHFQHFVG